LIELATNELRGDARNGLACLVCHALENVDQGLGKRDPDSTVHLGISNLSRSGRYCTSYAGL
jgi:hypothetical protein